MRIASRFQRLDFALYISTVFLIILSIIILRSIAPSFFPLYFLFLLLGLFSLLIFSQIDFEILTIFKGHFYLFSILFLILPIFLGQITRGAIRWIPIGALTIQPSEIVRPFLLIFFANYLTEKPLSFDRLLKALLLLFFPVLLILVQPSLGVAFLLVVGFLGVLIASNVNRKSLLIGFLALVLLVPFFWLILADYQKLRVISFLDPYKDPFGAGYNSIQSMISVGSGKLLGRGLGEGVQTQLAFLPERHTDFMFAAIAEEMGFVGAILVVFAIFILFLRLSQIMESAKSPASRAFVSGIILTFFVQAFVHIGMNLGLLPITGVPLPLVSAGGSSLLATLTSLGMVLGARRPG